MFTPARSGCNLHTYEDADKVFDDLYIVPRKQTHRLLSGSRGELLFKACNDTWSREPLEITWTWSVAGRIAARGNERLEVEPGHAREFTVVIDAPETDTRLDGTLSLESRQGAKIYRDERLVPVLPRVATLAADVPVTLLDRSGRIGPFLDAAGVAYTTIKAPDELRGRQGVAVVGPDSLTPAEALGNDLLLFAMQGGRVLVLEQESPVSGGNLPVPMHRSEHIGGYAHPQALGTDVFRDLDRHDLIDWAGDHPTFKKVYFKPSKGARSLAQAGDKLQYSPLVELPCGDGNEKDTWPPAGKSASNCMPLNSPHGGDSASCQSPACLFSVGHQGGSLSRMIGASAPGHRGSRIGGKRTLKFFAFLVQSRVVEGSRTLHTHRFLGNGTERCRPANPATPRERVGFRCGPLPPSTFCGSAGSSLSKRGTRVTARKATACRHGTGRCPIRP